MPKDYPIDLAKKHPDMKMPPGMGPDEHYPSIHLSWDSPYDLPDSGTITFAFRTVRKEEKTKPDGDKEYCLDLDLVQIVSAKESKVAVDERLSAEDTLDSLKAEAEGAEDY